MSNEGMYFFFFFLDAAAVFFFYPCNVFFISVN